MSEKTDLPVLTSDELSKVEHNMLNAQQLQYLLKKTPKAHIYKRPAKGGGTWTYVTGVYMKKVLNLMFGWDWSFEIVEHKFDLNIGQCYVLGKLTVTSNDKTIVKMQFGRADIKFRTEWIDGKKQTTDQPLDIGNDLKAASTDALKKCASELGIASDVYAPEEFKEIKVMDSKTMDNEEMHEMILEMLNDDRLILNDVDRMHIERILEEREYIKYKQIFKKLTKLLTS